MLKDQRSSRLKEQKKWAKLTPRPCSAFRSETNCILNFIIFGGYGKNFCRDTIIGFLELVSQTVRWGLGPLQFIVGTTPWFACAEREANILKRHMSAPYHVEYLNCYHHDDKSCYTKLYCLYFFLSNLNILIFKKLKIIWLKRRQ